MDNDSFHPNLLTWGTSSISSRHARFGRRPICDARAARSWRISTPAVATSSRWDSPIPALVLQMLATSRRPRHGCTFRQTTSADVSPRLRARQHTRGARCVTASIPHFAMHAARSSQPPAETPAHNHRRVVARCRRAGGHPGTPLGPLRTLRCERRRARSDRRSGPRRSAGDARSTSPSTASAPVGTMLAALDGLDAVVFMGGVGEHAPEIRARAVRPFACLGLSVDDQAKARARRQLEPRRVRTHTRHSQS